MTELKPPFNSAKVGEYEAMYVDAVYLDGEKQTKCLEFNIAEGWLERYTGEVSDDKQSLLTEKVSGTITVDWKFF